MNYYVDSLYTGAVSDGGINTPWKTKSNVSNNIAVINAGDSILFRRGGTYPGGTFTMTKSGTASLPITFGAYGAVGAAPTFTGGTSTIYYLWYLNNINYIIFDGLKMLDPAIDVNPVTNPNRTIKSKIERAFSFDGTSHHNIIRNCDITAVGVGAHFVGPNNTMDHCNCSDLTILRDTPYVSPGTRYDDYGANPLVIESANNTVTNNTFFHNWAHSFDFTKDGGAVEFFGDGCDNNLIAYNVVWDNIGITEFTGSSTGNKYHYNTFINNGSLFYFQNSGISAVELYNNIVIENVAPRLTGEDAMISSNGNYITAGSIIMKNNIFQISNGEDVAPEGDTGIVHTDNIFKLSGGSVIGFTAHATDITTSVALFTDTTNANPTLWDFTPIAGSPAINAGADLNLTRDILGNPIDPNTPNIGSVEAGGVTPPPVYVRNGIVKIRSKVMCSCRNTTDGSILPAFTGTNLPWRMKIDNLPYLDDLEAGFFNLAKGLHTITVQDAGGFIYTKSTSILSTIKRNC